MVTTSKDVKGKSEPKDDAKTKTEAKAEAVEADPTLGRTPADDVQLAEEVGAEDDDFDWPVADDDTESAAAVRPANPATLEDAAKAANGDEVILRSRRKNRSYNVKVADPDTGETTASYVFTRDNPFQVMPRDHATHIRLNHDGFELVEPEDVQSHYDK